jgi:hypothetical protein
MSAVRRAAGCGARRLRGRLTPDLLPFLLPTASKRPPDCRPGAVSAGSGGRIRTCVLWVMSREPGVPRCLMAVTGGLLPRDRRARRLTCRPTYRPVPRCRGHKSGHERAIPRTGGCLLMTRPTSPSRRPRLRRPRAERIRNPSWRQPSSRTPQRSRRPDGCWPSNGTEACRRGPRRPRTSLPLQPSLEDDQLVAGEATSNPDPVRSERRPRASTSVSKRMPRSGR